ncbi:N-acetylmuramoyl-L-alanine amidase [Arthrobacter sp. HLT1-21]
MWLSNLADGLRAHGLTVVEIPGWKTRGFLGRELTEVRGTMWHHTATNRARFNGNDAPTLQMCIDGRPDVAGPLCHVVFGRTGVVYVIAAGLANHAGAGYWLPHIGRDVGNYQTVGIEMESSGIAPWDWTADQIRVAPYLGRALRQMYGHTLDVSHQEYSSTGKIDPAGWPGGMDGLRNSIRSTTTHGDTIKPINPKEWDEMASKEEIRAVVREELKANRVEQAKAVWSGAGSWINNRMSKKKEYAETALGSIEDRISRQQVMPLRAEVAALRTVVAEGSNLTPEKIEASIEKALGSYELELTKKDQ